MADAQPDHGTHPAPTTPSGPALPYGADAFPANTYEQLIGLLANNANRAISELGYHPNISQENQQLHDHYRIARHQNGKLLQDNHTLAQFMKVQSNEIEGLKAELNTVKTYDASLRESLRLVTRERDELNGRLHAAYVHNCHKCHQLPHYEHSIFTHRRKDNICRPRHKGNTCISRVCVNRSPPASPHHMQIHHPAPPQGHFAPGHHMQPPMVGQVPPGGRLSHPQRLPQHRASVHGLLPLNTAVTPNTITHRRSSAPATHMVGPGMGSPMTMSPVTRFGGMTLSNSPVGSRPGSAAGPSFSRPPSSASRPPSSRGMHPPPPPPHTSSPSSLHGAIIDLTQDDPQYGPNKRLKLEHGGYVVASPPASVVGNAPKPPSPPSLAVASREDAVQLGEPAPTPHVDLPTSSAAPTSSNLTPVDAPVAVTSPASAPPPTDYQPAVAQMPTQSELPPAGTDASMEDEASTIEEDCLDAGFDEDKNDDNTLWCRMCRRARFATLCFARLTPRYPRLRFEKGHTSLQPTPFVNATQDVLLRHCESVHPYGWEILRNKIIEQRAAEEARRGQLPED
ncbi:uncharacterized protein BXZ73DRAFT_74270 [Epithele typhae]|uniref:uncharacterized protein n=1 Tax=Epithele typhae TaxID=378194 RepID=UPI00200859E6|nr:uncharacterized protein BXZ73DRAFT_74270 [Epithele typhae]KAH9943278.1 hypothetical protein BXZ73DRAFT_74270 [Epithele typhae]